MRKLLLLTGLVLGVVSAAGCQSNKTPTGPASVTVTQTTSTTTSIVPPPTTTTSTTTTVVPPLVVTARRYFTFLGGPNVPRDMSLLFQLTASSSANSFFGGRRGLRLRPEADNLTYSVQGVYTTASGIGGSVKGIVNGSPNPLDDGQFTGTLTAEFTGCTAERQYSGPITSQFLQWTAGRTLNDCPSTLTWPPSFTLLRSDAAPAPPPAATTTIPTNTTTSVPGGSTTQSTRFSVTITSNTNTPIPADLSLFFRLLSGGLGPFNLARVIRPLAPTYAVTGGYTASGFSGSVTGTLDGTPDSGHFTGVFTADLPNCTGRTNYDGTITRVTLTLNSQGQIDSCGGNNPLAGGVVGSANGAPATTSTPTTTTSIAATTTAPTTTTTSTTSILTTTTTSRPTTTTTSIPTTTTTIPTTTSTIPTTSTTIPTTTSSTTTTIFVIGSNPRGRR